MIIQLIKRLSSIAILSATAFIVSGCSYLLIDAPENKINHWGGQAANWDYQSHPIIDSDPLNRQSVISDLSKRLQIPSNRLARSHRFHITFDSGEITLTDEHRSRLSRFIDMLPTHDYASVVTIGFTDKSGAISKNQDIGSKRASNTLNWILSKTSITSTNRFSTSNSQLFKHNDASGRRAEVWLVP